MELTAQFERVSRSTEGEEDMEGANGWANLGDRLYVDGSAEPSAIRGLERAGSAIVEDDGHGNPSKIVRIAVPRHLPQTAQSAEYVAMASVYQFANRAAEAVGDCLGVVKAMGAKPHASLAARKKYGGIVLSTWAQPHQRELVRSVRWTKAHRKPTGDEPPEVLRDIAGNNAADKAANEARELHPSFGPDVKAAVAFATRRAPWVARAVSAALERFPRAPGNMQRKPRPRTVKQAQDRDLHFWRHQLGTWRCKRCQSWTSQGRLPRSRLYERCEGADLDAEARRFADNGHVMCRAAGLLPFSFCSRCGGWKNRRSYKLSRPCAPPTAAGEQALRRISAGWHPWRRKQAKGMADEQRTRVNVMAAYDSSTGQWGFVGLHGHTGLEEEGAEAQATIGADMDTGPPHEEEGPSEVGRGRLDGGGALTAEVAPSQAVDVVMSNDAPLVDDTYADEEDVFDHGGCLDEPPAQPGRTGSAATSGFDAEPTAGAVGRGQRLEGVSMNMLVTTVKDLPKRLGDDDAVRVYDGVNEAIVETTVRCAVAEISRRRARGVRDDDEGHASDLAARRQLREEAPNTDGGGAASPRRAAPTEDNDPPGIRFTSRAQLLMALRAPSAGASDEVPGDRRPALHALDASPHRRVHPHHPSHLPRAARAALRRRVGDADPREDGQHGGYSGERDRRIRRRVSFCEVINARKGADGPRDGSPAAQHRLRGHQGAAGDARVPGGGLRGGEAEAHRDAAQGVPGSDVGSVPCVESRWTCGGGEEGSEANDPRGDSGDGEVRGARPRGNVARARIRCRSRSPSAGDGATRLRRVRRRLRVKTPAAAAGTLDALAWPRSSSSTCAPPPSAWRDTRSESLT